jgi:hypothetical protein
MYTLLEVIVGAQLTYIDLWENKNKIFHLTLFRGEEGERTSVRLWVGREQRRNGRQVKPEIREDAERSIGMSSLYFLF